MIILAVIILALGVGYYFAYTSINTMKAASATIEAQATAAQTTQAQTTKLQQQIASQASDRAALQSLFVQSGTEADFLTWIESLADTANLDHQIESVSSAGDSLPSGFQHLHIIVSTKGGWQSTYKFLKLLENAPYKLDIQTVDFTASQNSPGDVSTSTTNAIEGNGSVWQATFTIQVVGFI